MEPELIWNEADSTSDQETALASKRTSPVQFSPAEDPNDTLAREFLFTFFAFRCLQPLLFVAIARNIKLYYCLVFSLK